MAVGYCCTEMNRPESHSEQPFTIHVDAEDMTGRIFRFPNTSMRLRRDADILAGAISNNDPSLSLSYLWTDKEGDFFDIRIDATTASDWMSSSGEELGTPRQDYVFRRLGEVSLD
jgi:hypothetical protein